MDFSALRKFPWNEEIYLAQQGDTQAVRRTCATAEPIVDQFGKVSYFVGWLGKDEVRSIASLALVEFIMSYSGGVPDEEIPAQELPFDPLQARDVPFLPEPDVLCPVAWLQDIRRCRAVKGIRPDQQL